MLHRRELYTAFKVSIPVMMGYVIIGFAFGLLFVSYGYDWYLATTMSIFVYAGALQFLAIGMINAKVGFFDLAIASLVVNLRQAFYGLSVLRKFKTSGVFKPYLIFALTDETYALLTSIPEKQGLSARHYYFYLSILNQSYWVTGTTIGAVAGDNIDFNSEGLEFSLTALFIVLAIEQYKAIKSRLPFVIGTVSAIAAYTLLPMDRMLVSAMGIALLLMFLLKRQITGHSGVTIDG